jgi:hypothetical protein
VGQYHDARSGQVEGHDEVSFGSLRRQGIWRTCWVLAVGAALIVVVAITAVGHGKKPPAGPVIVTGAGHRLLGVTAGWELFGRGPRQVVRIQLADGRLTRTAVPPVQSTGPVFFVVGPGQVIIRPLDSVPGYLVPDGHPARSLPALFSQGEVLVPGPSPRQVWVQAGSGGHLSVSLARVDGTQTGVFIRLPAGGPWLITPDGRGYLLLYGPGSFYDARPGVLRRISGTVTAVGPTRWLVTECHGRCSNVVVDPASGARHILPGPPVDSAAPAGVIAPDGSKAAVVRISATGLATLHLLNLASGADQRLTVPLAQGGPGLQTLAWSPDSQWLLAVAAHGKLVAINADTGHIQGVGIPLPPISQIAIRSSPHQSHHATPRTLVLPGTGIVARTW